MIAKAPPSSSPSALPASTHRSKAVWSLIAVLCFVVGIGGGVLLRKPNKDVTTAGDRSDTAKPDISASAGNVSAKPSPSDAIAREAAEQVFGQHFRRGYQNFHAERYSQAVQDFERATEVAPHLAEGHFYLGRSYAELFLTSKAEVSYRRTLELMSDFRDAEANLAKLLYNRGAYREAIELLRKMERETPDDPVVQGELALNYLALGEQNTAIPLLEKFIATRPREAWGYAQLGQAHDRAGDLTKAEQLYRQALQLDRYYARAHHWLGLLLARTDRDDQAQAALAEFDRLRKLETTEQNLSMALQTNRPNVQQLVQLADTRFKLGKRDAAWKTLAQAEQLAPGNEQLAALRKHWTAPSSKPNPAASDKPADTGPQ